MYDRGLIQSGHPLLPLFIAFNLFIKMHEKSMLVDPDNPWEALFSVFVRHFFCCWMVFRNNYWLVVTFNIFFRIIGIVLSLGLPS